MNDFREYSNYLWIYEDNSLQHFGIKGMHWGIRRYQNPDGTLTEAGKKRYSDILAKAKNAKSFYEKSKIEKKLQSMVLKH